MIRWIGALLLLLLPLSSLADAFNGADGTGRIYVFGDSLSDTGNAAIIADPVLLSTPPVFGRLSNGPLAVEVFASLASPSHYPLPEPPLFRPSLLPSLAPLVDPTIAPEAVSNFAFGTARASGIRAIISGDEVNDLTAQVSTFLAIHEVPPPDALYLFIIGSNDVRDARNEQFSLYPLQDAVASIDANIRTLAHLGAHRFLVINAPDIGQTPETRQLTQASGFPPHLTALLTTKLTHTFNRMLSENLDRIRADFSYMDMELIEFDLFKFSRFIHVPGIALNQLDFTNIDDACVESLDPITMHPDCQFLPLLPDDLAGANMIINRFFFFDFLHPTARVHHLIGKAIYYRISHSQRLFRLPAQVSD